MAKFYVTGSNQLIETKYVILIGYRKGDDLGDSFGMKSGQFSQHSINLLTKLLTISESYKPFLSTADTIYLVRGSKINPGTE